MSKTMVTMWSGGIEKARGLFDEHVLRKARYLVDDAKVSKVELIEDGKGVAADVLGGAPYRSSLVPLPDGGWKAACNCARKVNCKHAGAVFLTVLDAKAAAAKATSAVPGRKETPAAKATIPRRLAPDSQIKFGTYVAEILGRPLTVQESSFCQHVDTVFRFHKSTNHIDSWSLSRLGIRLEADLYGYCEFGPRPATHVVEFWHFLAYTARNYRQPVPEFLKGIPIPPEIEAETSSWYRKKQLRVWFRRLDAATSELVEDSEDGSAQTVQTHEFRLILARDAACLEHRVAGQEKFVRCKLDFLRGLDEALLDGALAVEEWSRPLVDAYLASYKLEPRVKLTYQDAETHGFLCRLFRIKPPPEFIVGDSGEPVQFIEEPLRWEVTAPAEGGGDYQLRLLDPEGAPPPPALAVVGKTRCFYVSSDAVRPSPPVPAGLLAADGPNAIPSEIIETPSGVRFLTTLRCVMPERLESRVQRVVPKVSIGCRLVTPNVYSSAEYCEFDVAASAASPLIEFHGHWDGRQWQLKESQKASHSHLLMSVVDQSLMDRVPKLMEMLGVKFPSYYGEKPKCRVTKNFPGLFAAWVKSMPPEILLKLDKPLKTIVEGDVSATVKLQVEEDGVDWFNLRVTVDTKATDLTSEEIKALLDARGSFVRLKGKGWRRLAYDLTPEEDEKLAKLGLSPHELSSEPQRLHALQLANEAAKKFLPAAQIEKIERRASEIRTRITPHQPAAVKAELRPYQTDGYHFLAYLASNRFGGILADDMGLGKTLQALTWLAWLRKELHESGPVLVVCPKSVTDNWRSEAAKFTPELRVRLWTAADVGQLAEQAGSADLHILNYVQLRMTAELVAGIAWSVVILDEGQNIKNPDSKTAQASRALKAVHRLVLSGTPIENRLLDLWSLMAFAMPGALGNRSQFMRTYDAKGDPLARQRLTARVRPFLLRRTKGQVARDLPDRIEEDLFCELEGEQKRLYQAELKLAQQRLLGVKSDEQLAKERFHFLTSLLRLRQICCHVGLIKEGAVDESAKLNALLDMLEPLMEEGHKVLVFSQFVGMLNLLETAFEEKAYRTFKLTGSTEDRGDLVRDFQAAEGSAIFLISLKAGGFGLNLTAASYVVLFDPWWNPAVENQAIDRTHRIGQSSKVIAYRLLIKNSIEEKIRQLQKQKSSLASDLLGEEKFAQSLTMEDLQFLLA